MHIARAADLDVDIYYEFDGLEDNIFLAENNAGGDLEACRQFMQDALGNYPSPPAPRQA